MVERLRVAFEVDYVVLGGGGKRREAQETASGRARAGDNTNAFKGGLQIVEPGTLGLQPRLGHRTAPAAQNPNPVSQSVGISMMTRHLFALFALAACTVPLMASAQTQWTEGKNYFNIVPSLHTSAPPGKVEVTEVFSYGCPHCAQFRPVIKQLKASLPANAVFTMVPASFNPGEDWPMFQRAFVTRRSPRHCRTRQRWHFRCGSGPRVNSASWICRPIA